jgi:hypothetical protein
MESDVPVFARQVLLPVMEKAYIRSLPTIHTISREKLVLDVDLRIISTGQNMREFLQRRSIWYPWNSPSQMIPNSLGRNAEMNDRSRYHLKDDVWLFLKHLRKTDIKKDFETFFIVRPSTESLTILQNSNDFSSTFAIVGYRLLAVAYHGRGQGMRPPRFWWGGDAHVIVPPDFTQR